MGFKPLITAGLVGLLGTYTPSVVMSQEVKAEPFDYCSINENSTQAERVISGENIVLEERVFGDNSPFIIEKEDVADYSSKNTLNVTLVPVGYDDKEVAKNRMETLLWYLNTSYAGVSIEFSYVTESATINAYNLDQFVIPNKGDVLRIKKEVKKKIPTDRVVLVLNTSEHLGTNSPTFTVLAGEASLSPFIAVHEVAHSVGLGDGYESYYPKNKFRKSELFLDKNALQPYIKKVLRDGYLVKIEDEFYRQDYPIVDTGNVCNEKPVYSVFPTGDIMDQIYTTSQLTWMGNNGRVPFNPFQQAVMNEYIKRKIQFRLYKKRR